MKREFRAYVSQPQFIFDDERQRLSRNILELGFGPILFSIARSLSFLKRHQIN